jgi:hypothetical protein
MFTIFCWGFAIPAIIIGIEVTPLMFFAGVGICFVGAAAQIEEEFVYRIHMVAAIGGIVFSQLAIIFGYHMWYVSVISAVLSLLAVFLSKKHYFWWIEIIAFLAICFVTYQ